jgi:cystathionine beta-lyase family protein involved in aluminum resistance
MNSAEKAMNLCKDVFGCIEEITEHNQKKMLDAFIGARISESHFGGTTGYGYNDSGRDKLDEVFANVFGTQDALVRHNFVSGTHALSCALFGVLRPGDEILSVTGKLYDTLRGVIGDKNTDTGSLANFGITLNTIDFDDIDGINREKIRSNISSKTKVVYIQRSRGYEFRRALSSAEINQVSAFVRSISEKIVIIVDNCYGEYTEKIEPANADLIVGSMIKNPGGGIAPAGGYITGKKSLVELCAEKLTAPGLGREMGATLGLNREFFMGTFYAPHMVGEALKTATFASAMFEILGYEVVPRYDEPRFDIVQCIKLGNENSLIKFCKGVQRCSPIDSMAVPEPGVVPGYENRIIMAAGTFTLGSSIELSADAPLRPPYAVWMQGGIPFYSAKVGVMSAAHQILSD